MPYTAESVLVTAARDGQVSTTSSVCVWGGVCGWVSVGVGASNTLSLTSWPGAVPGVVFLRQSGGLKESGTAPGLSTQGLCAGILCICRKEGLKSV